MELIIPHKIGDPYFKITAGEDLKPVVTKAGRVTEIHIYEDEMDNISYGLTENDEDRDIVIDTQAMRKNLWFWSKEEAEEWLQKEYKPENYTLKPGDKLENNYYNHQTIYTVKGLRFGGLYYYGSGGISTLSQFSYEHSYKNFFPRLENAWYEVVDDRFNTRVLIGTGTEDDPYRVDYMPTSNNCIQFPIIVGPIC